MGGKIKVLIVDDSAVVRQALTEILSSDRDIVVIGAAADPYIAAERMEKETPDVITLDIEMPRMDGLTFLEKITSQHPIPVVMCSSLTDAGCGSAMLAMECGAAAMQRCEASRHGVRQKDQSMIVPRSLQRGEFLIGNSSSTDCVII